MSEHFTAEPFGRLTILSDAGRNKRGRRHVLCQCACGTNVTVVLYSVLCGNTRSCGCLQRDAVTVSGKANTSHGHARKGKVSKTFQAWMAMISRCYNENVENYPRYGGRGITVCDQWRDSFEAFLADMGEAPEGTSLDRFPDNNGNYEPENCRWATILEQNRNKSNNTLLELDGVRRTISEWAEVTGLMSTTISKRMVYWNDVRKALTTPLIKRGRAK